MSDPAANVKRLDRYAEPAVLLDEQNKVLAWNDAFSSTISDFELQVGQEFTAPIFRFGTAPLEKTSNGYVGTGFFYQEASTNDEEPNWLMLTLPYVDGNKLVLFTQGSSSLVFRDELSGLPNRRDAKNRLSLEWRRMLRSTDSLFSIVMVDIDHFKIVNDRYGHDVGDEALRFISEKLEAALRAGDWVARWGGEEFLLFLYQADLAKATKAAERIRKNIESQAFVSSEGVKLDLTICLGVVCSDSYVTQSTDTMTCMNNMLVSSDILLYDAKQTGRNRSIVQMQGEKIYWDEDSLDLLIRGEDIIAGVNPVTDAKGEQASSMWKMNVRGEGEQSAHRVMRSALKQNRTTVVDVEVLKSVVKQHDKKQHGDLAFVPQSCSGLLGIADNPEIVKQVDALLNAGIQPVLVVDDEPVLGDESSTASMLDLLTSKKVSLCLGISDNTQIPTGIINQIKPSYVLINSDDEAGNQQIQDLLGMLKEHGIQPILSGAQDKSEPGLLYC